MNADSARRIHILREQMNVYIFDNLKSVKFRNTEFASKNVDLFKIFSELELIKKLKTVKFMDYQTFSKYEAFLKRVASYRHFIEGSIFNRKLFSNGKLTNRN